MNSNLKIYLIRHSSLVIILTLFSNICFANDAEFAEFLNKAEKWKVKATVPVFSDEPPCDSAACEEKILLGVAFEHEHQIKRESMGTRTIIKSETIFPYYDGKRELITDEEFRTRKGNYLQATLKGFLNGKLSGIFFYDGNGASEVGHLDLEENGVYLPEDKNCEKIRKKLKRNFKDSEKFYKIYDEYYVEKFCNKRVLQYSNLLRWFTKTDLFYFNGSGANNDELLPYMSQEKNALAKISLGVSKTKTINFYSKKLYNENKFGSFNVSTGRSILYILLDSISKNCDYDIDRNGQITMNEVTDQLSFNYLPDRLGIGPEELYDWNTDRSAILSGAPVDFSIDNYDQNYSDSDNAAGFTVVGNPEGCEYPPGSAASMAEEAISKVMADSYELNNEDSISETMLKAIDDFVEGGEEFARLLQVAADDARDNGGVFGKMVGPVLNGASSLVEATTYASSGFMQGVSAISGTVEGGFDLLTDEGARASALNKFEGVKKMGKEALITTADFVIENEGKLIEAYGEGAKEAINEIKKCAKDIECIHDIGKNGAIMLGEAGSGIATGYAGLAAKTAAKAKILSKVTGKPGFTNKELQRSIAEKMNESNQTVSGLTPKEREYFLKHDKDYPDVTLEDTKKHAETDVSKNELNPLDKEKVSKAPATVIPREEKVAHKANNSTNTVDRKDLPPEELEALARNQDPNAPDLVDTKAEERKKPKEKEKGVYGMDTEPTEDNANFKPPKKEETTPYVPEAKTAKGTNDKDLRGVDKDGFPEEIKDSELGTKSANAGGPYSMDKEDVAPPTTFSSNKPSDAKTVDDKGLRGNIDKDGFPKERENSPVTRTSPLELDKVVEPKTVTHEADMKANTDANANGNHAKREAANIVDEKMAIRNKADEMRENDTTLYATTDENLSTKHQSLEKRTKEADHIHKVLSQNGVIADRRGNTITVDGSDAFEQKYGKKLAFVIMDLEDPKVASTTIFNDKIIVAVDSNKVVKGDLGNVRKGEELLPVEDRSHELNHAVELAKAKLDGSRGSMSSSYYPNEGPTTSGISGYKNIHSGEIKAYHNTWAGSTAKLRQSLGEGTIEQQKTVMGKISHANRRIDEFLNQVTTRGSRTEIEMKKAGSDQFGVIDTKNGSYFTFKGEKEQFRLPVLDTEKALVERVKNGDKRAAEKVRELLQKHQKESIENANKIIEARINVDAVTKRLEEALKNYHKPGGDRDKKVELLQNALDAHSAERRYASAPTRTRRRKEDSNTNVSDDDNYGIPGVEIIKLGEGDKTK